MTEHSPLPFTENEGSIFSADGRYPIATIKLAKFDSDTYHANAAFILRACNNYYDMLEALERAIEIIHIWHGKEQWEIYNQQSPEMIQINTAIAKAKGEA